MKPKVQRRVRPAEQALAGTTTKLQKRKVLAEPALAGTKKRHLFAEIVEGFEALASQRAGKRTMRTHEVDFKPAPDVTPDELLALRERLHLSRPVFARYLRTNPRTLENWEQGRARPNAQAALLIRMVEQYPDTVGRLASV